MLTSSLKSLNLELEFSPNFKNSFKMQQQNYRKSAFTAVLGSGLVATIIGLTASTAFAQQVTTSPLTVKSTGTISGTLELPKFNPNFGDPKNPTQVDTDSNGVYKRNVGTKNNPNWVEVYKSSHVVTVNEDGTLKSYVNFLGIPVASFDAVITSPALSEGEMTTFRYDGRPDMEGTVIKGVVKDEFGVKKSYYTGIVTDPNTGIQYKGTFKVTGDGPRYSKPNGGDSPTVFDFKSDIPGKPTVESFKIQDNSPLEILKIDVPVGTEILTPSTPPTTPPTTGGSTPPTIGGSTPPTNLNPSSSPITSTPSTPSTFTPSSPSPDVTNIEFSSGNSFVSNSVVENPSNFGKAACSQDSVCDIKASEPKQRGPRSRVMMR
jgi:hypothetical protein